MSEPKREIMSRAWSCGTLIRGSSFLAEQQKINRGLTAADALVAPHLYMYDEGCDVAVFPDGCSMLKAAKRKLEELQSSMGTPEKTSSEMPPSNSSATSEPSKAPPSSTPSKSRFKKRRSKNRMSPKSLEKSFESTLEDSRGETVKLNVPVESCCRDLLK